LPSEGRQDSVGTFFFDDFFENLGSDRFHIGPIGRFRVRHDGGRIGVQKDNGVPFFLESLAGLGPGIVEFTGLADNDGPGTNNQNFLNIRSFRHGFSFTDPEAPRGENVCDVSKYAPEPVSGFVLAVLIHKGGETVEKIACIVGSR
jgi:hypothetical protein